MTAIDPFATVGGRFTRRTVVAAAHVLERLGHGSLSRLIREFGPTYRSRIRDEGVSLTKRCTDLIDLLDDEPDARVDGGDFLSEAIVEGAARMLPRLYEWSEDNEAADYATLRRALKADGYEVTEDELRRSLPNDLELPRVEDEVRRLLRKYGLSIAEGHLEQALENHSQGSWSAANGQLRNLLDSTLDSLALLLDPACASVGTGHPRRARLADLGFLSRDLNEYADSGAGFVNGLAKRLHPQGAHPGLPMMKIAPSGYTPSS